MTTTQFMRKGCLRAAVLSAAGSVGSLKAVRASRVVVIAAVAKTIVVQHMADTSFRDYIVHLLFWYRGREL
jgi:hypothetical protein